MTFSTRPLHEAANRRDKALISRLIADGHDPNEWDLTGRTPLFYLIGRRHDQVTCTLGGQPAADTDDVLEEERLKCMQTLLSSGANGNVQDSRGWSLIHQGAWDGDLPAVKYLASHGIYLHLQNALHQTPCDLAVIKQHQAIVCFLDNITSLQTRCRQVIRETIIGHEHRLINKLPLPKRLKFFMNFGIPYEGWTAECIPESPWNETDLATKIPASKIYRFLATHATEQHLIKHRAMSRPDGGWESQRDELVKAFKGMFVSRSFRDVEYEEPHWKFRDYSKKIDEIEREDDSD